MHYLRQARGADAWQLPREEVTEDLLDAGFGARLPPFGAPQQGQGRQQAGFAAPHPRAPRSVLGMRSGGARVPPASYALPGWDEELLMGSAAQGLDGDLDALLRGAGYADDEHAIMMGDAFAPGGVDCFGDYLVEPRPLSELDWGGSDVDGGEGMGDGRAFQPLQEVTEEPALAEDGSAAAPMDASANGAEQPLPPGGSAALPQLAARPRHRRGAHGGAPPTRRVHGGRARLVTPELRELERRIAEIDAALLQVGAAAAAAAAAAAK